MSFDFGHIDKALAAAAGEDAALAAELHNAFALSARRHADLLSRARCDANWIASAHRLRSLAASFGAKELFDAAQEALAAAPGDPVALRRVKESLPAQSA